MRRTCSRLLVTLVLLSVISVTARAVYASSSYGDDMGGGAAVGSYSKPGVGQTSSEPDSPSKTPPAVPMTRTHVESSSDGLNSGALSGLQRIQWISRIWAALYLRVIK